MAPGIYYDFWPHPPEYRDIPWKCSDILGGGYHPQKIGTFPRSLLKFSETKKINVFPHGTYAGFGALGPIWGGALGALGPIWGGASGRPKADIMEAEGRHYSWRPKADIMDSSEGPQ